MKKWDDEAVAWVQAHGEEPEPIYGENEIDFDDDRGDDQLPLDVVEAQEVGVLLDDPEELEPDGA